MLLNLRRLCLALALSLTLTRVAAADELPKKTATDLLGDPLPQGALARFGTVRFRHGNVIRAVVYSPDGKLIASAGDDGQVRIWDVCCGRQIHQFAGHGREVHALAFSPDSKQVASGGEDKKIRLWDVAGGKQIREFIGHQMGVECVAFSPDGTLLASGNSGDPALILWDVRSGKPVHIWKGPQHCEHVAFSADGKILFAKNGSGIQLWDVANGKDIGNLHFWGGLGKVYALSRHGKTFAVASGGTVILRSIDTGERLHHLPVDVMESNSLAFSPDGKTIAVAVSDSSIHLWDVRTGKPVGRFKSRQSVACLCFSPDGKKLVSGGWDQAVRLWDVDSGKEISPQPALQGHRGCVNALAFSPNGATVATVGNDGTLRIWEVKSGKQQFYVTGQENRPIWACVFEPKGRHIWSAGLENGLHLWDLADQKKCRSLLRDANVLTSVCYAPNGKMAATGTGSGDGMVSLWELPADLAAPSELPWWESPVKKVATLRGWRAMAFTPDNQKFLHQVTDGDLHLRDVGTGHLLRRFPEDKAGPARTSPVAFSADGRTLATVQHRTSGVRISLWETTTAKQRLSLRQPLVPVQALAFSPDGRLLAVSAGKSIRLWDLLTGKPGRSLEGHQGDVIALAFSSDGRALASASKDTTALLWDMTLLAKREKKKRPAFSAKNLEDLWDDLGRLDAVKGYQATWLLTDVPDQAIALFKPRLRPAAAVPIDRWIAELDDKVFAVRQKATADLASHVEQAEPALRRALTRYPSLEATRRIERLLKQFSTGDIVPSTDLVRTVRAIEVLERIGTAEARAILANLARGAPDAWVTREARGSLERLAKSN